MKLKYTYLFFLVISAFILLRSNSAGRTGATPQMQNCASAGCHNVTPAVGTTTIDSISLIDKTTGFPASQYTPGTSYRVTILGRYTGTANLHKFGFIVNSGTKGAFSGTNATSTTNVTGGISYWGHSAPKDSFIRIPLGPFSTTVYIDTCTWTAPAAGSGLVTFQGLLNAVNADMGASTDRSTAAVYSRNIPEFTANVNVAIGGGATFCAGTSKTFTATPLNGGATPFYQWYLNGSLVGTGGTTYTNATLANADSVWCVMTSSIAGIGNSPATSNKIKAIVNPAYNNSVTIVCNKTNVCAGDTAIYTATPGAGATGAIYRWYLNNGPFPVFTGNPYTKIGGFTAGDSISCRLQVTNPCSSPVQDTSNFIQLSVNASPVITPILTQNICPGVPSTKISFVSSLPSTNFTWTNNTPAIGLPASGSGDSIGSFIPINTGNTPINATITVKSFAAGCNGSPITFTISVRPVPKVRRPNLPTYCAGANVNIVLVTVPAGGAITWTNPNTSIGLGATGTVTPIAFTASNSTTDSIVSIISVKATAGGCTGPDSTFRVVVYPVPVVSTVSNIIGCNGLLIPDINFTTSVPTASLNWTNSDPSVGIPGSGTGNILSFTANNTSGSPKIANMSVTSRFANCTSLPKTFTITVNNASSPSLDIFSKDTQVCPGSNSLFKAFPVNGGSTPMFQWYLNGVAIAGSDKDTATIMNLMNNDRIKCEMISNSNCVTSTNANSRDVVIKTIANIVPKITLTSVKDTICQGQAVTINSSVEGQGPSPTYQWYVNGSAISGAIGDFYLSNTFATNDVVSCELTSSLGCAVPSTVVSNEYKLNVFPVIATQISMVADKTKICSDDNVTFTVTYKGGGINPKVYWTLNGQEMNTNVKFITVPISSASDVVRVEVKSSEVCTSPTIMIVSKSIDSVGQGPYVDVEPNKYFAFCEKDSAKVRVFNGASNLSYQWFVNGASTPSYTIDSFYSKSTNSFVLKVMQAGNKCPRYYGPLTTHMNALPPKPEISASNGVLLSTISDSYQWQLNKLDIVSANLQTYKMALNGSYRVKVSNSAGCFNYSDVLLAYPLGIQGTNSEAKLSIYPNPSTGNFYIKSEDKKIESVMMYDLFGKLVYTNSTKEMTKHIEVENLPKGNYFIQINTSNNMYQEKIELR
jgi:hypothetical protein